MGKIQSMRFISPLPRPADSIEQEDVVAVSMNNEFEIQFHAPVMDGAPLDHVAIVVNGFGQLSDLPYNDPQSGICSRLAQRNIASVLFPLPFHMNRWPKDLGEYRHQRNPTFLVFNDKKRFYQGYIQYLADLEGLIQLLTAGGDEFPIRLAPNAKIHLIGYSMGGLAILAYRLFARAQGTSTTGCNILLASGCSMRTLVPSDIGVSADKWMPFREHYMRVFHTTLSPDDAADFKHRIFRKIFLGKQDDDLDGHLESMTSNTFIIIGSEDEVNALRHVSSGLDNIPKYTTLVIPGWSHLMQERSSNKFTLPWQEWSGFIIEAIANYVHELSSQTPKSS